MLLTEV